MKAVRVLIAEDEPIVRMDLKEILESQGYEVVGEASDGQVAIELARKLKPDVIIMDIRMPNLDGIEAAKILTQENIAPIIFLTAYSDKELVEKAKEVGVVAYIVKPFKESDLFPAIEIAIARFKEFQLLRKEVEDLKDALETRKLVDRAKGILMDREGLKEHEAFRLIQKASMDKRKPMKEIAQAIILAYELKEKKEK
ncbi:ANTAR domain-containing response regulator [Dictyoglomus thermophilum]|uniref:Transcriptional regulatory protein PdtaR n=1 Tax=Dictyoglomus thermophilum (strain ATCC 35947 / DSM 3960 / H-6-12) TaxID=309799 RepID=B5YE74_DICT6|nr:response regulator [Dictyoglomus thermophilum]ACI19688.1 two-component system, regulatory protein [Dictyoglomus thermophilum H-6-12]MCX7720980.1 response regulator [Dictyoglomus thermophilum]TYT22443.1 response regulator [Dictyoglomus thermophilum]